MSEAVIINQGRPFAWADTKAGNGETVHFGWWVMDDGKSIHEIGTGKITRDKRYLEAIDADDLPYAYVNDGGGPPY